MMSINPEGSLYDDQGVEPFRKHHRPDNVLFQSLKEPDSKLLYPNRLSTPDIATVASLLTGVDSSLITSQAPTPTRFTRPEVSAEQEMYTRSFLEALDNFPAGNRQPEALAPSNNHKLVTSSSGMDIGTIGGPALCTSDMSAVSSHYISGHNHSIEAVAPTYVKPTMDYHGLSTLPSMPSANTNTEPASIYSTSVPQFVSNSYTPPIINFPSMDTSYSPYSTTSIMSQHSQPPSSMDTNLPPQMMKELSRVVPADIKTQEQMKVERKKARNRIAASKCRLRRLQRESDLQGKVRVLKEHNHELNNEVTGLKAQINNLKKALIQHMKGGCQVNLPEGYGLRTDSSSSE